MKKMFAIALPIAAFVALGAAATGNKASGTKVERGRYLVEQIAMCADCHTPHDAQGKPIETQNMQGAPLPFKATVPMPFAEHAPAIAGLPSLSTEQAIAFLTKGDIDRSIRPPMPSYRFTREDAESVVSYLQSLPPATNAPRQPAAAPETPSSAPRPANP